MAKRKISEAEHLSRIRRSKAAIGSAEAKHKADIVRAFEAGVERGKIATAAGVARTYIYRIVKPGGST